MTTVHARPQPDSAPSASSSRATEQQARIRFRTPETVDAFIDATWWPRSRDLTIELPSLLNVLWTAGRDINRVTYHLRSWDPAPRRMQLDGHTIRMGGFTVGDPNTITLTDPWGRERVDILVITPDTNSAAAQRISDLACDNAHLYRADEILHRAADEHHDSSPQR